MLPKTFFLFILFTWSIDMNGQAVKEPWHQKQLQEVLQKAEEFRNKNLNRFGLEKLQQYDQALNGFYNKEKEDTLQAIHKMFVKSGAEIAAELKILKDRRELLLKDTANQRSNYSSYLTNAALLIIALLIVFIFILFTWRKKSAVKDQESKRYEAMIMQSQLFVNAGEQLIMLAEKKQQSYIRLNNGLKEFGMTSESFLQKLNTDNSIAAWKDVMMHTRKMIQLLQPELIKNEAIFQYAKMVSEEKVQMDINKLCQGFFTLVKDGFKNNEDIPPVIATTDLEKNLPQIKVVPAAIGHLLTHILINAMQSVQAKAFKQIKGYEPRIALSTRILPRFLQIRIHDNGDGVEDRFIGKIREAFFSLKNGTETGLGLYVCDRIMKNHNGEIKIESDKSRGTDIYLKFYIN